MKIGLIVLLFAITTMAQALPISLTNQVAINPPYIHSAVRLEFNSEAGTYYQVQITDDLGSGAWENEGYSIKGTGGTMDALVSTRSYDPAYFRLLNNGDSNNSAPVGPAGSKGEPGDKGPPGIQGIQGIPGADAPSYSATLPVYISTNDVIGLNPASVNGDVLSWNSVSNHWVATRPTTLNVIPSTLENRQPYLTMNYIIALAGVFPSRNSIYDPTIAEIMMFGGNFAPRNWAKCDGQLLPISQYSALFSILGTQFGGDGRSTFALPDMRGRVAIHYGQGPASYYSRLGIKGGTEVIPTHTH